LKAPVSYASVRDAGCVSPVQWSVDSAYATIVSQTDSTVQLQYKQSGAVTLYGQIVNSCGMLQDSMAIQVIHTTAVFLGNDTSFCPGESVVLDAGSGFQSYSWSTGAASEQIVASTSGTYWVTALNANSQCLSADTVTINVYPAPVVNIGPDISICRDSLYEFNAGNGFSTYLWQDGSANSVYFAGQVGIYWVKVTDQNGCSASDTARILSVQNNPADFLAPTAQVCSKGQQPIQVNAIGIWARYLWSDGSTAPSIIVDAPGEYWLQVATGAGCTAVDTITVTGKACPFGIFFPNAFSPNNDGNNDVYRPKVYLLLDKFYMAIYNRLGAKVYETSDPSKGWDGTFNGQPQPSGAFVWYAQYHVQGSNGGDVLEKGTLMLIR
jgi:gliding motility-associated-like protein